MDLDDLLEDVPDNKMAKQVSVNKPVVKPKTAPKQDDGWGDLANEENEIKSTGGFGLDSGRASKIGSALGGTKEMKFGYGGETGLKKGTPKKANEDDEWALDSKPTAGGTGGGRLLGRKPKKEEDDLDSFLDVLEAKRGIESTKIPSPKNSGGSRPKTASNIMEGGADKTDTFDDNRS